MGSGSFSTSNYRAAQSLRSSRGIDDFSYSRDVLSGSRDTWKADPTLEPYGVDVRESRDSDEHPNSTPIVVLFDVTGSMGYVPRVVQQKLGDLFGLLLRKGYVDDPQVMVGAIGDHQFDRIPLQVGQFESDNRIDEQLRSIVLEGGGGGNKRESYDLAAYFIARHTVTDRYEKRGQKGYMFIIGDEMNYGKATRKSISKVIGGEVGEDVSIRQIYDELSEKWEVFHILPNNSAYYHDIEVRDHWEGLLGERSLKLDNPDEVSSLIALTVGVLEESITMDEGLSDLGSTGTDVVSVRDAAGVLARKSGQKKEMSLVLDGEDDL